jgi:glycerol-3-phosphate acyltransferase PlsY
MEAIFFVGMLILSYVLGSVPFGMVIVRLRTGKDIRKIESGRTGGTNVARAAGFWAGLTTAILDGAKGAVLIWVLHGFGYRNPWLDILLPVAAILGHNYSIFLTERDEQGRLKLHGGAGGATCVGGSGGLWFPSIFIIIPVGAVMLFGLGYASVATLSVAVASSLLFAYRAWTGTSPWQYALYGVFAEILLLWALRPNIKRLFNGTERVVGLRARLAKSKHP